MITFFRFISTFVFMTTIVVGLTSLTAKVSYAQSKDDPLTLNKLYDLPSIIGTTPKGAAWSDDNSHIAFLWNNKGREFRDVWLYSLNKEQKYQVTNLDPKESSAEVDKGVEQVVWLNSQDQSLAYIIKGKLYFWANGESQQVEDKVQDIRDLQVSPNGKSLAFTSKGGLYVRLIDGDSNVARHIIKVRNKKSHIQSYQWALDSSKITFQHTDNSKMPEWELDYYANGKNNRTSVLRAFPGNETSAFRVGIVSISNGAIKYYDRPNVKDDIWNYGLSPNGQSLFINSSDQFVQHHTIYMFDINSGKRDVFYYEYDEKHLRPDWRVKWAPEGNGLIILTDRDGYLHLYHQKSITEKPLAITSGEWEIAEFEVDNENDLIYFTANKSHLADRQLYRVPVAGGAVEKLGTEVNGTHEPISYSPDMKFAASIYSNDQKPQELYVLDIDNKLTKKVTDSPLPEFNAQKWANIAYITFPSYVDDTMILGRLHYPKNYDKNKTYPMIVGSVYSDSARNQYGGRIYHPTHLFDQYMALNGYFVLNVNVRGSWGQGRKHNQGLHHSYGEADINDLESGVRYLVKENMVDPKRVGIWGSSYGGLMTMMSMFKKPGLYAAGIAGAPATNVRHAFPGQMWVMGPTTGDDMPERFDNQSAKFQTKGLEDPLMIIHGSKDQVVLYSDTLDVVQTLIEQEKMFELVTLPGVVHGWDAQESTLRKFAFKKMVQFFDRHLKP
jgi:dipeptidyl-peptidase-4